MLEPFFTPRQMAAAILKEPLMQGDKLAREAIILSHVDNVVQLFPELPRLFVILERKGCTGWLIRPERTSSSWKTSRCSR